MIYKQNCQLVLFLTNFSNVESKVFPALQNKPKPSKRSGFTSESVILKSASKRIKKRIDEGAKSGTAEEKNSSDDESFNGFDEISISQSVELTNSVDKFRPVDDSQC